MNKKPTSKILIVDDEEGIRESLKLILEDHYDMILVENGAAALETLEQSNDIGLVLLDIKMPKIHGLEVLTTIKDKYKTLPVVMVTGYKIVETAQDATSRGANGYIIKPFKSEEILETVRKNLK